MTTIRRISILSLLLLIFTAACQQRERNLEFLEAEIVRLGYTGQFEKPSGGFQRMALELVGVEDFLAFRGEQSSFIIFEMKPGNEKDVIERVESVLSFAEGYISDEDRKNITESKGRLREHSFQHGNILLLWEDSKPEDLAKVIRRNF